MEIKYRNSNFFFIVYDSLFTIVALQFCILTCNGSNITYLMSKCDLRETLYFIPAFEIAKLNIF